MDLVDKDKGYIKIKNVLISVFNKDKLMFLVKTLMLLNPEVVFYSPIQTYKEIFDIIGEDLADLHLVEISDGVDGKDFEVAIKEIKEIDFDLVVMNFQSFAHTVMDPDCTPEKARANIYNFGLEIIEYAENNQEKCVALCHPTFYPLFCEELINNNGSITITTSLMLMGRAVMYASNYKNAVFRYLSSVGEE